MDGFKNNLSPASTFLNQETNNYILNPEKLYYCMYYFIVSIGAFHLNCAVFSWLI